MDALRLVGRVLGRIAFVAAIGGTLLAMPAMFDQPDRAAVSTTPSPKPPLELDNIDLKLTLVARVPRPTAMATRWEDDALYVASKKGQVYSLRDGKLDVVLDIEDEVSYGFEQGLLGLAFTPDGKILVINFTNRKDASVTRAYRFDDVGAEERTGKDLLVVPKPAEQHNAGNLAYGPDDYLYLSLGDGGLSGDPKGNAQSLKTVLGKIHRFEVRPDLTMGIPPTNPFVKTKKAQASIWAYGFRNPWRFSFDRRTGDLWVSDVGRDSYEEINMQPAAAQGGRNYGWNHFEGPKPYVDDRLGKRKKLKEHVLPIHAYKHKEGICAVTGGFVYRGLKIEGLDGAYLYSDYCRGGIDAIRVRDGEVVEEVRWKLDVAQVSSFGQDQEGELYVLALTEGIVYRIDQA